MVIIQRGWPGSGKTTLAKRIQKRGQERGKNVTIYSTDDFWLLDDGCYKFDASRLDHAHAWNQWRASNWLETHENTDYLIIDNCNIKTDHFGYYRDEALRYIHGIFQCYPKEIESVLEKFQWVIRPSSVDSCDAVTEAMTVLIKHWNRCIHNVPLSTIVRMAEQFETSTIQRFKHSQTL